MIQFYLLSVVLNITGGYALIADASLLRGTDFDGVRTFLRGRTVRLVLGILTGVTGALKLVTVVRGDIPVVGDFLPAVAGMAVGVTLLLELYRATPGRSVKEEGKDKTPEAAAADNSPQRPTKIELLLINNKVAIGIAGIIAGVVHFLFPMVLFL